MGRVTSWMNPLVCSLHRQAGVTSPLNRGGSVKDWKLGEINMDHKTHNCDLQLVSQAQLAV